VWSQFHSDLFGNGAGNAAYNLARYLMRNETEAEDVVPSAYVRAIGHFAGLRGGDGRVWLLMIVRNAATTG
jgi:DNA-directed RNA polymerase specialized sigma24 family protein